PRHSGSQPDALPTELHPPCLPAGPWPARAATVDTSRSVARRPNRLVPVRPACRLGRGPPPRFCWWTVLAWGGNELGPPVVLQFADGLGDIGQRPVGQSLDRLTEVDPWVPAPAELLD